MARLPHTRRKACTHDGARLNVGKTLAFEMPSDVSPARISTACPVMSSSSPPPSSSAASTTLVPDCRGDAGGAASLKRALPEALLRTRAQVWRT
eukprot:365130-Chlamydomonas_euryale.AAC.23